MNPETPKELDQWYTSPETASICIGFMKPYMKKNILEPSCGTGVFIKLLESMGYNIKGFDIDPKTPEGIKKDFFLVKKDDILKDSVTIGNPPYGKKGKLAQGFINHALSLSDTVGFIVPLTLSTSYTAQKHINENASLILEEPLPKNSFVFKGKTKDVKSVFQIWSLVTNQRDLRLKKPQTQHPDFETRIYNKTQGALKYLDWDWDIAIKRNTKNGEFITEGKASADYHWMLVKVKNKEILKRFLKIDYTRINDNKMTAGMGKADIVKAYLEVKKF